MKITKKKLSELKPPEKNARMHTDKQIAEFQRSIKMFGQIRPIVVDENNVVLAGNGLMATLQSMGYETADCYVVTGLSENEKKKLMLADNRIFDLGVDDMAAFDALIAELGDDLDVPGFDDALLQSLTADAEEVDTIMSSYGLIDDTRKAQMESARENYDKQETATEQLYSDVPHETDYEDRPENSEEQRRCVICPKCGERIWL